jgi:hypothetical protein
VRHERDRCAYLWALKPLDILGSVTVRELVRAENERASPGEVLRATWQCGEQMELRLRGVVDLDVLKFEHEPFTGDARIDIRAERGKERLESCAALTTRCQRAGFGHAGERLELRDQRVGLGRNRHVHGPRPGHRDRHDRAGQRMGLSCSGIRQQHSDHDTTAQRVVHRAASCGWSRSG